MNKLLYILIPIIWLSCDLEQDPNLNKEGEDVLETNEVYIDAKELMWQDTGRCKH